MTTLTLRSHATTRSSATSGSHATTQASTQTRRRVCLFVLAAALPLLPTLAQAHPYDDPRYLRGAGLPQAVTEVVVTPSRAARAAFATGRAVDHIDQRRIRELQADTAHDALRETPGVAVQQTNRGAGVPVIRGLVGPSNVVVVDGLRFNQATWRTGPSQYLTTLDPSAFRGFEVLSGPASVHYGAGAMGGVVAALPWRLRQAQGVGARGTLRFVSQDRTGSGQLHLDGRHGALAVGLGGALRRHGTLTTGGGAKVPLSDWQQQAWHGSAGWQLGERTRLRASYRGAQVAHAGRVDQLARGRLRIYDNADDYATLDLQHRGEGRLRELRVAVAFHRTDEQVARFDCDGTDALAQCVSGADRLYGRPGDLPGTHLSRERRYQDTVSTLGALAQAEFDVVPKRISLDVGVEAWRDEVNASSLRDRKSSGAWAWKDAARGNFSAGTTWLESGLWAAGSATLWRSGDMRLLATAGGRGAHFRGHAGDVPGLGAVDYSYTGLVGSANVRLVSGRRWMVYADVSQGFRAPNVQETTVLGDTGSKFEVPNGDLGPERGLALEVGGRLRRRGLSLQLSAFVNRVTDFIDERQLSAAEVQALGLDAQDVGSNPVIARVNRGSGLFVGAQGLLRWKLPRHLTPFVQLGWSRGDVTAADGTSTPARRVMPLQGSGGVRWAQPTRGLWFAVVSRFAAAQDRLHPSDRNDLRICADPVNPSAVLTGDTCTGTPAWATLNVRGGWRWHQALRLDLALTNILDATYREHGSGFDAAGTGLSVSLSGRY